MTVIQTSRQVVNTDRYDQAVGQPQFQPYRQQKSTIPSPERHSLALQPSKNDVWHALAIQQLAAHRWIF